MKMVQGGFAFRQPSVNHAELHAIAERSLVVLGAVLQYQMHDVMQSQWIMSENGMESVFSEDASNKVLCKASEHRADLSFSRCMAFDVEPWHMHTPDYMHPGAALLSLPWSDHAICMVRQGRAWQLRIWTAVWCVA